VNYGGIVNEGLVDGSPALALQFDPSKSSEVPYFETTFYISNVGSIHFGSYASASDFGLQVGYYLYDSFSINWLTTINLNQGVHTYDLITELSGNIRFYFILVPPEHLPANVVSIMFDNFHFDPWPQP
jgi:hypothetical protein